MFFSRVVAALLDGQRGQFISKGKFLKIDSKYISHINIEHLKE